MRVRRRSFRRNRVVWPAREEHARQVRKSERDERMQEWFDRTEPGERRPAAAVVLLGIVAVPVQLCTIVALGVALVQRLRGQGSGRLRRPVLIGLGGVQVLLQAARWAVLRRLDQAMADGGVQPAPLNRVRT